MALGTGLPDVAVTVVWHGQSPSKDFPGMSSPRVSVKQNPSRHCHVASPPSLLLPALQLEFEVSGPTVAGEGEVKVLGRLARPRHPDSVSPEDTHSE
jgi:hypothetical protein